MRVVRLGIAYAGEELDRPATISTRLTHRHLNASAAAVATCRLLRLALRYGARIEKFCRLSCHWIVVTSPGYGKSGRS